MNLVIWTLYWIIGSTVFLWAFYAVIVPLVQWSSGKANFYRGIVMSAYGVFWLVDVAYNLITGSLIFWEWPQESPETFSARLRRHYYGPSGWRQFLAHLFRINVNRIEAEHI